MPKESKETKSQRVERLKREKNPWECFGEIERFAREGYSSILPEWLSDGSELISQIGGNGVVPLR